MPIIMSAAFSAIHDQFPHGAVALDPHGFILDVNSRWVAYGLHTGLSSRFDWTGANYYEMMEDAGILYPDSLTALRRHLDDLFAGERLVYSGTFPKPSTLSGRKWFTIEAFPPFGAFSPPYPCLFVSHRDIRMPVRPAVSSHSSVKPRAGRRYLPICAACKSIPDRHGTWRSIEHFLEEHLQVELTHDICPSCIAELYPQYAAALHSTGSEHG